MSSAWSADGDYAVKTTIDSNGSDTAMKSRSHVRSRRIARFGCYPLVTRCVTK